MNRAKCRHFTEGEVEELVAAMDERYRVLVYVAAYVGLRGRRYQLFGPSISSWRLRWRGCMFAGASPALGRQGHLSAVREDGFGPPRSQDPPVPARGPYIPARHLLQRSMGVSGAHRWLSSWRQLPKEVLDASHRRGRPYVRRRCIHLS
jgi:hypothetical protein